MKEADKDNFTCAYCHEEKPHNNLQPILTQITLGAGRVQICKVCDAEIARKSIAHIVQASMT